MPYPANESTWACAATCANADAVFQDILWVLQTIEQAKKHWKSKTKQTNNQQTKKNENETTKKSNNSIKPDLIKLNIFGYIWIYFYVCLVYFCYKMLGKQPPWVEVCKRLGLEFMSAKVNYLTVEVSASDLDDGVDAQI